MIIDGKIIEFSDSDDVDIEAGDGNLYLNGRNIHIGDEGTTDDIVINPRRSTFIAYKADPESWEGDAPLWLHDAVDRLAYALAQLGKKP